MSVLRTKGFTIVELLIVIVVIGILSTITIVAYNGFTERARNAARVTAAKQALESTQALLVSKSPSEVQGELNYSGGWYRACFGTGYKNIGGSEEGDCADYEGSPYVSESADFNALLKTYSSLPDMQAVPPVSSTDGDRVLGPYIDGGEVDGKDMLLLEYSLEGIDQACTLTPLAYYTNDGYSLTPPSGHGTKYTSSGHGVTECMVVVSDTMY